MTKTSSPWNIRFNFLEVHYTYTKTASQAIGIATQNARAIEVTRPTSQAIHLSSTGTKLIDILKVATQAIGFAFSSAKMKEVFRTASQTITTAFGVNKQIEILKDAVQSINFSSDTAIIIELGRLASITINVGFTATVTKIMEVFANLQLTVRGWGQRVVPGWGGSSGSLIFVALLACIVIIPFIWRRRS